MELPELNALMRRQGAAERIARALQLGGRTIATTSFGPNSAVLLHLLSEGAPQVPIVWVDSGYNLRDTYMVAEQLMERLRLNMHIVVPQITAERLNCKLGGIPTLDEPDKHSDFTRIVKLEPFARALRELQPQVWISGLRAADSEFRRSLELVGRDERGMLKVSPLLDWSDDDMEAYMHRHHLPSCRHYFDPTKVQVGRECGMHTSA